MPNRPPTRVWVHGWDNNRVTSCEYPSREAQNRQLRGPATRQAPRPSARRTALGPWRSDAGRASAGEFPLSNGSKGRGSRTFPDPRSLLREMTGEHNNPLDPEIGDFAEMLKPLDGSGPPVVVGGHAVGFWARHFQGTLRLSEPRSPVFDRLEISARSGHVLKIEVLHTVHGLGLFQEILEIVSSPAAGRLSYGRAPGRLPEGLVAPYPTGGTRGRAVRPASDTDALQFNSCSQPCRPLVSSGARSGRRWDCAWWDQKRARTAKASAPRGSG